MNNLCNKSYYYQVKGKENGLLPTIKSFQLINKRSKESTSTSEAHPFDSLNPHLDKGGIVFSSNLAYRSKSNINNFIIIKQFFKPYQTNQSQNKKKYNKSNPNTVCFIKAKQKNVYPALSGIDLKT